VSRGASLQGSLAHFLQSLKMRFKQKFKPVFLKNAYFLKQNRFSVEGSASESSFASVDWRLRSRIVTPTYYYNFVEFVSTSVLNAFHYPKKVSAVNGLFLLLLHILHLFFTSNSVVFVDGMRNSISCPRAQGTLATPLTPGALNI